MKNIAFLVGICLILLNSVAGLYIFDYSTVGLLASTFSIFISTLLVYFILASTLGDGFKIGLSFFFGLTGLSRFISAIFLPDHFARSYAFLIFSVLIVIEIILYALAFALKDK